jgi:methylglutaconyl-CoA hydratase
VSQVRLRRDGRTAHVTLASPDAGNRITRAMMLELIDALRDASGAADVLVLSGEGEDFCLGRDQTERPAGVSPQQNLGLILEANRAVREFAGISLALVQGRALGFGSGLAMQCDLVLAAETAVFAFDEIAHGFPPLLVQSYLLDYVPRRAGLDLVLTGRHVEAQEARSIGIVGRVVAADKLASAGAALAEELCGLDSAALRRGKDFFAEVVTVPSAERGVHALNALVQWRAERP